MVNPVVAPGLTNPALLPIPTASCCTYFYPHNLKLTLEVLSSCYSYTISAPSFITQTTPTAQKIIPDRELFVISRALLTVPNVLSIKGKAGSLLLQNTRVAQKLLALGFSKVIVIGQDFIKFLQVAIGSPESFPHNFQPSDSISLEPRGKIRTLNGT